MPRDPLRVIRVGADANYFDHRSSCAKIPDDRHLYRSVTEIAARMWAERYPTRKWLVFDGLHRENMIIFDS